jgi:thiamine biosynthesis lipoprotein
MGTYVTIQLWSKDVPSRNSANRDSDSTDTATVEVFEAAFAEVDRIDSLTSVFSKHSAVYALNKEGIIVSQELADLLDVALRVADMSDGAFDPTVMPLLEAWGFYNSADGDSSSNHSTGSVNGVPTDERIEEILQLVDYRMVEMKGDTVDLDSRRARRPLQAYREGWIDLSGIAKGYAVDRSVAVLRDMGIEKGLVDAGGDIFCFGLRKKGWRIGIKHPREQGLLGVIRIDSGAVATSGDYENFYEIVGVRYHHLIDPRTGKPARGQVSATVTAPTAVLADAWATALFIMGKDGIVVLEEIADVDGMLVLESGEILTSSGFPEIKRGS